MATRTQQEGFDQGYDGYDDEDYTESETNDDLDDIDFENYKGIFFQDEPGKKYQDEETGAHFEYEDMCKRMLEIANARKQREMMEYYQKQQILEQQKNKIVITKPILDERKMEIFVQKMDQKAQQKKQEVQRQQIPQNKPIIAKRTQPPPLEEPEVTAPPPAAQEKETEKPVEKAVEPPTGPSPGKAIKISQPTQKQPQVPSNQAAQLEKGDSLHKLQQIWKNFQVKENSRNALPQQGYGTGSLRKDHMHKSMDQNYLHHLATQNEKYLKYLNEKISKNENSNYKLLMELRDSLQESQAMAKKVLQRSTRSKSSDKNPSVLKQRANVEILTSTKPKRTSQQMNASQLQTHPHGHQQTQPQTQTLTNQMHPKSTHPPVPLSDKKSPQQQKGKRVAFAYGIPRESSNKENNIHKSQIQIQPFPNQEKDVETSLERNPKPIKNNYVEEHRQFLSFVSDRRIATNPINSRQKNAQNKKIPQSFLKKASAENLRTRNSRNENLGERKTFDCLRKENKRSSSIVKTSNIDKILQKVVHATPQTSYGGKNVSNNSRQNLLMNQLSGKLSKNYNKKTSIPQSSTYTLHGKNYHPLSQQHQHQTHQTHQTQQQQDSQLSGHNTTTNTNTNANTNINNKSSGVISHHKNSQSQAHPHAQHSHPQNATHIHAHSTAHPVHPPPNPVAHAPFFSNANHPPHAANNVITLSAQKEKERDRERERSNDHKSQSKSFYNTNSNNLYLSFFKTRPKNKEKESPFKDFSKNMKGNFLSFGSGNSRNIDMNTKLKRKTTVGMERDKNTNKKGTFSKAKANIVSTNRSLYSYNLQPSYSNRK